MSSNLNSEEYWDQRFSTGHWDDVGGRDQTRLYATVLVDHLDIPRDFPGTILDFGCALGDAIPVYREAFPNSGFLGLDHSESAVSKCRSTYGEVAEFIHGDQNDVPPVDVIIASHILEHIDNDQEVATKLLSCCRDLYIVVPFRENPLCKEHVHYYDENYYRSVGEYSWKVFPKLPGNWTPGPLFDNYLKNFFRFLLGKKRVQRKKVVLFHFSSPGNGDSSTTEVMQEHQHGD
jgi:hypothetical protein